MLRAVFEHPRCQQHQPRQPKGSRVRAEGGRGRRGCEGGLARNVFNHSSHLPSVTLRLRRDAAEGAGTTGRCWMLLLPRRLCGVWTCRAGSSSSISQEFGWGAAELRAP